jgi:nucleotide-binding universal stress UspA family protein
MGEPIVVGIDGSAECWTALELACREAAMRRLPLRVVHALAWPWPTFHMPDEPPSHDQDANSLHAQANALADAAVDRARRACLTRPVSGEVIIGFPDAVLLSASHNAAMVVIGQRAVGAIDRLLRGSVVATLTARAQCPVLISRGRPDPSGNVLLAVDIASRASRVLDVAFEEAMLRGVPVGVPPSPIGLVPVDDHHQTRHRTLPRHNHHLSPTPRTQSRESLIEATKTAQLLVMGRSVRTILGRRFSSSSHALLQRADCPVLIVSGAN